MYKERIENESVVYKNDLFQLLYSSFFPLSCLLKILASMLREKFLVVDHEEITYSSVNFKYLYYLQFE